MRVERDFREALTLYTDNGDDTEVSLGGIRVLLRP